MARMASGSTTMGKKLGVKDYRDAKVQEAFSDGEAERAIKEGVKTNGKETMKPFGEQTFRGRHQGARRLRSFVEEIIARNFAGRAWSGHRRFCGCRLVSI